MVDGTGLENRHTRKGIGGSNPSLSAIAIIVLYLQLNVLRFCSVLSGGVQKPIFFGDQDARPLVLFFPVALTQTGTV